MNKISKRASFEAAKKTFDANDVAQVLQDRLFFKHGVPELYFQIETYWNGLNEVLNIRLNKSTADHPQTDDQSKNLIQTLCNMLRSSLQKVPENWELGPSFKHFLVCIQLVKS